MIDRLIDTLGGAAAGLRVHRLRMSLAALGVALGIGSLVAVVGISASSRTELVAELDALGTDILVAAPGSTAFGGESVLPTNAASNVRRLDVVRHAAGIVRTALPVRRSDFDDEPNGLEVLAVDGHLLRTIGGVLEAGRDPLDTHLPVAVLGSKAAERLAIRSIDGGPTVTIGGERFQVVGVAAPLRLHPDLNRAVWIGRAAARGLLGVPDLPTKVIVRVDPVSVDAARPLITRAANTAAPHEVEVSRPSDALEARARVDVGLRNLLLAVGSVGLLVAGVGIANTMTAAVWERRREIGVRRALGATSGQVAVQFATEAVAVAGLGGLLGTVLGALATAGYVLSQGGAVELPLSVLVGGAGCAAAIGAVAGLLPALKAARVDPVDAIRS